MTKIRAAGLGLLCSTFLAACGGQKPLTNEIEAPQGPQQTSFTLDHHYDTKAYVSIDVTSARLRKGVIEHIDYVFDEDRKHLNSYTSINFGTLGLNKFYQSLGAGVGDSYSTWFLNDRQERDQARLRNIFAVITSKADGRIKVNCKKPQEQKTLTCVVSKI